MFNPRPALTTPGWSPTGSVTSSDPRGILPTDRGVVSPSAGQSSNPDADVARWDAYVQQIQQAMQASAGAQQTWQRKQLEAQLADAEKARQNAMAIARLSAETSRYGVDVGRQNLLEQLKEQARQFDQNHGLELQRFGLDRERFGLEQQRTGLDYAKTATEYLATPDSHFRAKNYLNMAGRVFSGQPGIAPYEGAPQPRTEEQFAVLAGGGNPLTGQSVPRPGQPDMATAAAGAGAGADNRLKALKAVFEASPPSAGSGYDDNDFAALNAARAIYGMNLTPKQQASLAADPSLQAMHRDAGRVSGYDVESWEARQRRSLPGQGSVRSAA